MKLGSLSKLLFFLALFFSNTLFVHSEDKIESVPLINLEDLSPTFEEEKDELEKIEENGDFENENLNTLNNSKPLKKDKIYINITALDKITAKTSTIRLAIGDKKFFGSLEIMALKCQFFEGEDLTDTVAYLQVKDLSVTDNNQVFLFNGWTFASSPTLKSIDHPVYDLWINSCDNI